MWVSLAAYLVSGSAHRRAIDGDNAGRYTAHRGNPGDEAALELLNVENGQHIAGVTMVRLAMFDGRRYADALDFAL